jgi:hypothetical protein
MGLHAEDRRRHSDESHMSNLYRRRKLGLSKITLCFMKTRNFREEGESHCDRECHALLGIAANIRDGVTPCVYNIRISANMQDCVMLSAFDITTGAKVRNTLIACETELKNFTIHGSANIKIIATPSTPIIIKLYYV